MTKSFDMSMQQSARNVGRYFQVMKDRTGETDSSRGWFGDIADKLWQRHDELAKRGPFQNGAVCLVGFDTRDSAMLCGLLRETGLGPCGTSVTVDSLRDIAASPKAFPYLLVNLDAFEDSESAVDAMLAFRKRRGDAVVILVAKDVAADDLTAERRMICDATLRAPVTLPRLRRGIAAAFSNNTEMRRDA